MINGSLIDTDSSGFIVLGQTIYSTLSGTYTPATTGLYTLEIYNYSTIIQTLIENYVDDITLVPLTTDFSADTLQFSVTAPAVANFSLDAGVGHAGEKYLVLLSITGNWPGVTNGIAWLPLNNDPGLMYSFQHANGPLFPNTAGTLNASGQATAGINFPPVGATYIGRTFHFAYMLHPGNPMQFNYGSMPVSIFFIP